MEQQTPSVRVTADVSRNILQLAFIGTIRAEDMPRYEAEITRGLRCVRPGFSLLTDFSEMDSMETGCVPHIENTMDAMRNAGVQLVVRVIPDRTKDIGMNIMSLFHYPHTLKIVTTETREEAEHIVGQD